MAPVMKSLSHRHDYILDWLICNPHRSQRECARELGYTEAWLSQIINSDLFQAEYKKKCRERGLVAVHSIANQMTSAASLALERSIEILSNGTASERFIGDTRDSLLDRLGFGKTQDDEPDRHLHIHVDAAEVERARERCQVVESPQKS